MVKVKIRKVFSALLCAAILACATPVVFATNEAPVETEVVVENVDIADVTEAETDNTSKYNNIDSIEALKDVATLDSEDIAKGAKLASPVVSLLNTCVAVLVALLAAWILANSVLDLICLCVTPFSKRVLLLHTNPQQAPQDWMTKVASFASEQAIHALIVANGGSNNGANGASASTGGFPGGGFPGGGFPGGGFPGSGGFPGASSAPQQNMAKPKATVPIYLRKRAVFLVLFGVCLVVFTCTAFTDLGIKFGNFIINAVGGLNI